MRVISVAVALVLLVAGLPGLAATLSAEPSYAISMYGDLKYGPGFRHFEYVNPRAPKGGNVKLATTGTFDNLNPFILKGVPAAGIGLTFDTLLTPSGDEAFSEYGLLAESVETPPDRAWVAFTLRREARFHDGTPVTADDLIWTFETLKTKGHPQYRAYYSHVVSAEKVGPRTVRFAFKGGVNRELPLIVGQLPVLSKAYWSSRDFTRTTLEPPLGSGPYKVESLEQGRVITYRRVKDYWGANLPVNVGRHNFETLRYDYYRDLSVLLEAFKGGAFDYRQENSSKNWATGYESPALRDGRIKKEEIPNQIPSGMQGFTYNTRRPMFADRRVRAALAYAFDFEWTNAHLFYGAYKRTESYFANSELAARGRPGPDELAVLEPFRGKVPDEVFTREYHAPFTGPGGARSNLVEALKLLEEAGWVVRDMRLVNARTGQPMTFEILIGQGEQWERIGLPFLKNLEKLGVTARVRPVDAAQYEYRTKQFDYDMTVSLWGQSLSPGNEQIDFWTSEKANEPGSQNYAGIRDPVVDALVAELIAAPTRAALVARCRALDRVLLWGHYVIPHWHLGAYRVAYWDKFGRPAISPKYSVGLDTWWVKP
ncbi:MAG TPA: extracellular solute-binding protein [Methylomirabilota bacterium]